MSEFGFVDMSAVPVGTEEDVSYSGARVVHCWELPYVGSVN